MADRAVRPVGADQVGRLDSLFAAARAQGRAHPIRSRFQTRKLGRPLHHRAVLGQALLEDPLGLRLEQGEHEVVAMRHPRELDRREQALAAVEAEAVQAQTTCQKALGHARCLHQLERPRVDADRLGVLRAGRVLVDDAHRAAVPGELQGRGEAGRPGADHQDGEILSRRRHQTTAQRDHPRARRSGCEHKYARAGNTTQLQDPPRHG